MGGVHEKWERLVSATLRREQLIETALRTPTPSEVSSGPPSPSPSSMLVSFSYHQLLVATNRFAISNLLKHGHSGDLYLGVVEAGIQVVVKKVNMSSLEKRQCVLREKEMGLGGMLMLNHSRLLPPMGHCSEDEDHMFLVYEYMDNEDLSAFLSDDSSSSLDWTIRLNIAIGAAEGLCYLHRLPPYVHRDIRASSILLDDDFQVRLGSLSRVCCEEKDIDQNRIAKFLRLHKGFEQSNSIAVVAKACLDPKPSKRPRMAEVLKALQHTKLARFTETELKPGCIPTSRKHGFFATSRSLKFYPDGEILSHSSVKVFTFLELKDATRNFGMENWLGQDEFGRVYRGLLRDKLMLSGDGVSVIAVKRMNLKIAPGFQEWQSEVEMLGRLSHPNVLGPLGYCWEDNELMIVYEYMQIGSLKNFLFQSDSAIQPLAWDSRVKILIGAAKGLTFLHAAERRFYFPQKKERGGFFGYFKCSKILIDSDYNAKITGFGVAEVNPPDDVHEVHPLQFTNRVDEYASPEYKIEGNSVLESDVYGFGVVLVRMLTGSDHYHPLELADPGHHKFIKEKMDPRLRGKFPLQAASKITQLACLCLQQDPKLRPGMKRVSWILQDIANNSK